MDARRTGGEKDAYKGLPWEKAVEKDWLDPRFKRTDTGPFFDCTAEYPLPGGSVGQLWMEKSQTCGPLPIGS